jgi:acyl-coenzyme A synthetase/AMP-(fatty) acid ligase
VVGAPDKLRGEALVAYIVRKNPALSTQELHKYCINHPMLADYKKPRYYRFINELPYTATGKKKRYIVSRMAVEDQKSGLFKK